MSRISQDASAVRRGDSAFALSVLFFCALLGHNIFKLGGSLSFLQLTTLLIVVILSDREIQIKLFLSAALILVVSGVQYFVVGDTINLKYEEYLIKYPVLLLLLLSFMCGSTSLFNRGYILNSAVEVVAWLFLGLCFLSAIFSYVFNLPDFPPLFYDNPNETAVAVSAAYLYLAFNSRLKFAFLLGFMIVIPTIYIGSSRYSMMYVAAIFALAALPFILAAMRTGAVLQRREPLGHFLVATIFLVLTIDLSSLNHFFQLVSIDKFGIEWDALWLAWDTTAPPLSSIGYRVNNVLAALGALFRTFGVGIGLGRSAALTEQISGLAGSIHVSPIEFFVEFGVYGTLILLAILTSGISRRSVLVFSCWMGVGMMSMCAQSSAYLTSYVAWFFIVALAYFKARQPQAGLIAAEGASRHPA
jgi:hypothetical protein